MTLPKEGTGAKLVVALVGMAVAIGFYPGEPTLILVSIVAGLLLILVFFLFFERETEKALSSAALSLMGVLYVPVLASFLVLLKDVQETTGVNWIILLFLVVWINDAGAYFSGRKFGKRKLFERISPKKTIEGSAGGLAASVLSVLIWNLFTGAVGWADALPLGLCLGVIGPIGDLVESMLKRACRVKDSGNLIPGHGGILDRVDSVIFCAPALYFFVLQRGV